MNAPIECPMNRCRVITLAAAGLLLLLAPAIAGGPRGQAPESGRSWTTYREAGERATVAPADVEPIYLAALRFYRPPRNQARWLDTLLLPSSREDTVARYLDRDLAGRLVRALGERFSLVGAPRNRPPLLAGRLRVSRIYAASPDRVRVVVATCMVWPQGVTTDNGAQAFVLERAASGWVIADRGGAATPP